MSSRDNGSFFNLNDVSLKDDMSRDLIIWARLYLIAQRYLRLLSHGGCCTSTSSMVSDLFSASYKSVGHEDSSLRYASSNASFSY